MTLLNGNDIYTPAVCVCVCVYVCVCVCAGNCGITHVCTALHEKPVVTPAT